MISQFSLKQFTKSDLKDNPELLIKLASISHEEFVESDYPLPVPNVEWFRNLYSLKSFPYEEQSYLLVENEEKSIGYGLVRSNEKMSPEMAYLFVYLLPEYRGQRLLWPIVEKLTESIPSRIEKFFITIRSDESP